MALLTDKTAVVTGAASGNGRAIAEMFADHGAAIVVADIQTEPRQGGTPTHELINEQGGEAAFVECDVTEYDDCVTAVEEAEEFGGVDIMVNNAGIVGPQVPLVELDFDEYQSLMNINLTGVFHGSKAAALKMIEHGDGGSIINMSSVAGMNGYGGITPYSAAKGGTRLFSYALANELGPDGIRVNAVHPGVIETAMTVEDQPIVGTDEGEQLEQVIPLRRFGEPDDVAGVCTFLASDLSSYVSAESIVVDGGNLNSA
jgi:NAD(P)-dependent dehydrogenase (short-subunit alcohol dehydrogenase family)